MRRALVIMAVPAAAALALGMLWARGGERPPDPRSAATTARAEKAGGERERERAGEPERKRVRPSVHRATPVELAQRNRVAAVEAAKVRARIEKRKLAAMPSVPATTWVPLGPTDSFREYNSVDIGSVAAGRPADIIVDPRDPNVVYVGVSGGGVWKTIDFLSPSGPTWIPITDTQPNLDVGSLGL